MITTEQTSTGQQFVMTSRSGRRYVGSTAEEAERKHLISCLHAFARESAIVREVSQTHFGTSSFGQLTIEQMRTLRNLYIESKRAGKELQKLQTLEPKLTDSQRKRLIKLGLYVLGPVYGKEWFWKKCKEWVPRFKNAARVELDDLTNQEAWYLIRRLEKIEKRLKDSLGVIDETEA